jgi:hypothetical protein
MESTDMTNGQVLVLYDDWANGSASKIDVKMFDNKLTKLTLNKDENCVEMGIQDTILDVTDASGVFDKNSLNIYIKALVSMFRQLK